MGEDSEDEDEEGDGMSSLPYSIETFIESQIHPLKLLALVARMDLLDCMLRRTRDRG